MDRPITSNRSSGYFDLVASYKQHAFVAICKWEMHRGWCQRYLDTKTDCALIVGYRRTTGGAVRVGVYS